MKYLTPWAIQYGQTDCESEGRRHVVPSRTHKSRYFSTAQIPRPEYLSVALMQRDIFRKKKNLLLFYKIMYTKQNRNFAWSPCLRLLKYRLSQRQDLLMIYSLAQFNMFSSTESLTLINTTKANERPQTCYFYSPRNVNLSKWWIFSSRSLSLEYFNVLT